MTDDSSPTYETLRVERADGVVTLTMTRPEKKNAMSHQMFRELLAVFEDVAVRRDDRVLLITGEGDGFCSGADLTDSSAIESTQGPGNSVDYMRLVGRCALRLHELVSMSDALEFEGIAQSLMFRTADTTEAMLAFVQKRDPSFRGQ